MEGKTMSDKILYIIRGIPGAGKSTLAHKLTNNVAEADQFMYEDGIYKWSPIKLHNAHRQCFEKIKHWIDEGVSPIAVANTFIKKKEYREYKEYAEENGYEVIIKVCDGGYNSIHNVPSETLNKMKARFEQE
jgi:predicted ABC-type ATPase